MAAGAAAGPLLGIAGIKVYDLVQVRRLRHRNCFPSAFNLSLASSLLPFYRCAVWHTAYVTACIC